MSTSRKSKATLKKEEILTAAKELFAKQGYHATSTRSINTAIGASDGLMYHYFPGGKKELLLAVVEHELNIRYEYFKEKTRDLPLEVPLEDFLHYIFNCAMQNISRDSDIFIILIREASEISTDSTELLSTMFTDISSFVATRLKYYVQQKVIREDLNIQGMLLQFAGTLHTYALLKVTTNVFTSRYTPETYMDFAVKHIMACWKR